MLASPEYFLPTGSCHHHVDDLCLSRDGHTDLNLVCHADHADHTYPLCLDDQDACHRACHRVCHRVCHLDHVGQSASCTAINQSRKVMYNSTLEIVVAK